MPDRAVVVHFGEDGELTFAVAGDVRLFIVDERAPNDRVFEWLGRVEQSEIAAILGDSEIGNHNDGRHAAIEAKVVAFVEGRPHLREVSDDEGD